jgi:hypothetical protein
VAKIGSVASSGTRSVMSHPRRLRMRKVPSPAAADAQGLLRGDDRAKAVPLHLVGPVAARRDRARARQHRLREGRRRGHRRNLLETNGL